MKQNIWICEVESAGCYTCGHVHKTEDAARKCLDRKRGDMPALWHSGYITCNGERADGVGVFRKENV